MKNPTEYNSLMGISHIPNFYSFITQHPVTPSCHFVLRRPSWVNLPLFRYSLTVFDITVPNNPIVSICETNMDGLHSENIVT
jgi:hypothetical protein